jgi:hypothetical protein
VTRRRAALVAVALGACGTPTPQIQLALSSGDSQTCPDDCKKIPLPCDAVMSIRIVDPDAPGDPAHRHLDQCERVPPDRKADVCSLNAINLDLQPLPVKDLEVQIAVFPGASVPVDPETGDLICPDVRYSSASGFPVEYDQVPALGGTTYYHPGDQTVNVVLGCTDLSAMNAGDACNNPATGALTAGVDDFDTRVPVTVGPGGIADHLFVSVGEPHSFDGGFVLNPADAIALHLDDSGGAIWTAASSQAFLKYACVEVLEDVPQAVATLRCSQAAMPLPRLSGMRINKTKLQSLLASIGLSSEFPTEGLTIGMVVDQQANGVENYIVSALPSSGGGAGGTVTYMATSDDGTPTNMTSKTGIFISRDAPFGTIFSARGQTASAPVMAPAVGGLVAGKVTIVVIAPMAGSSR